MSEKQKWIDRAKNYKNKTGIEMVTIYRGGIYDNWPASQFDKCGDVEDVVYRTDRELEQKAEIPRMTIPQYAKSVYEKMGE